MYVCSQGFAWAKISQAFGLKKKSIALSQSHSSCGSQGETVGIGETLEPAQHIHVF